MIFNLLPNHNNIKNMEAFINKIPENYQGKPLDLEVHKAEGKVAEAQKTFKRACKRLQNPPLWHKLVGALSAVFTIENSEMENTVRLLGRGDYLKINIHSPEAMLGLHYDWVQVKEMKYEKISAEEEYFLLTLEVASNPNSKNEKVEHFFKEGASSSFVIQRKGRNVSALYYGRNETPNTENNSMVEKLRNGMVALGAMAGFSNLQWKALLEALLQPEL